ncbi:MAG: MFS transporter [Alphaproteobacteria bacterium]|nr:MFS transporter [Alphaproteobacteria bacterium]
MVLTRARANVLVLALGQALFVVSQTTLVFLGGLVGYALASDKAYATLPVSCVILGTATGTVPAALYMRIVGRRLGFFTGAAIGVVGTLICAYGIYLSDFYLFCAGAFVVGIYNGFCQYYRFAAAETSDPAFKSKAISFVLAGGVLAALIGPELANRTKDLLAPITYLASYLALTGLAGLAMALALLIRMPPEAETASGGPARPLTEIARLPLFIIAVLTSVLGYMVMSFMMTASPLAVVACNYPVETAGFVIQWHVLGMFVPSFFTGHLIGRFGVVNVIAAGSILLLVCVGFALAGIEVVNFWAAMTLLGVGWNFMFVGATSLLTEIYRPSERAKVQACNDFLVFGSTATASLMSGKVIYYLGWQWVGLLSLPAILVSLGLVLWLRQIRRVPRPA